MKTLLLAILTASFCHAQIFEQVTEGDIVSDAGNTFGHSWGDYNNDGYPDLLVNNIVANEFNLLYVNNGDGNFAREDGIGTYLQGPSTSSCWGDFNNDGYSDIFIANGGTGGSATNYLLKNVNGTSFERITEGLLVTQTSSHTTTSWVDLDADGYLDLFLGRSGSSNQVYWNTASDTFSSRMTLPDGGSTWGVSFADFDNDGDMDFFCANWGIANYLYKNNGDGSFARVFDSPVVQGIANSIGGSWGDYDNDGDFDLFVSNTLARSRLFRNDNGTFEEIFGQPMVTDVENCEGSAWADIDNDGFLDLITSGGGNVSSGYNAIYAGDGAGNFTELESKSFNSIEGRYEGLSLTDIDNDGFLDAFISNHFGHDNQLFRNTGNGNGYLLISLNGIQSNRSAIGARVSLKTSIDGTSFWQYRQITGQTGHVAQSGHRIHFGLSNAGQVDSLAITWPSGLHEIYFNVGVNKSLSLQEGEGTSAVPSPATATETGFYLHANYPNPFNPSTVISYQLPEQSSVVLRIFDVQGRQVLVLVKDQQQAAGQYAVTWNGTNQTGQPVATGIYFYQLVAKTNHPFLRRFEKMRKMLLIR